MAIPTMMALAAAGPPSEPLLLEAAGLRLQVPASINCHLRDYQRDGVRFLFRQFSQGKGGILADDMGLGKTIQSIGERLLLPAILRCFKPNQSSWYPRSCVCYSLHRGPAG